MRSITPSTPVLTGLSPRSNARGGGWGLIPVPRFFYAIIPNISSIYGHLSVLCSYRVCPHMRQFCAAISCYIFSWWRRPRAPRGPPRGCLIYGRRSALLTAYSASFLFPPSHLAFRLTSRRLMPLCVSPSRLASRLCVPSCVPSHALSFASHPRPFFSSGVLGHGGNRIRDKQDGTTRRYDNCVRTGEAWMSR